MASDIDKIEKRLWSAADNLRANSNFASNEYFMPVMGLIFLRHAYSRYLKVKAEIESTLPSRCGKVRDVSKKDFWISYFDSYLNENGRAGFVISSQASSAGGEEAKVRKQLIEAGHVDIMMAIRSGFFYTRSVPRELWYLNKAKPTEHYGQEAGKAQPDKNRVLMIDARNLHRKVTRWIYDFSPEQQKNLTAIVWLYRGQQDRFLALVADHLSRAIEEGQKAAGQIPIPEKDADERSAIEPYVKALGNAIERYAAGDLLNSVSEALEELKTAEALFGDDVDAFQQSTARLADAWDRTARDTAGLTAFARQAEAMADASRDLIKQVDHLYKLLSRVAESDKARGKPNGRGNPLKELDALRKAAGEQLKLPRTFWKHAHWLLERFPDAELRDVPGLIKLVDEDELEANDWSLTPGRYVGTAPEEEDEDFDFEEMLREIHIE